MKYRIDGINDKPLLLFFFNFANCNLFHFKKEKICKDFFITVYIFYPQRYDKYYSKYINKYFD